MSEINRKTTFPNRTDRYLVKLKDGTITTADYEKQMIDGHWQLFNSKVVWWMEIPQELKEKEV